MRKAFLLSFFISMLPLVELRLAIPFGVGLASSAETELSYSFLLRLYALCLLGNMLPVPFIFLFARKFLEWGSGKRAIGGVCRFFLEKGHGAGEKLYAKAGRGLYFALFLFVALPLPGTGAWTGTLAASLLDMNLKKTTAAVMLGILLAGLIMMSLSFGLFSGVAILKK